jgi:hypothetical protein
MFYAYIQTFDVIENLENFKKLNMVVVLVKRSMWVRPHCFGFNLATIVVQVTPSRCTLDRCDKF